MVGLVPQIRWSLGRILFPKYIYILNRFGVSECFGVLLEKYMYFLFICGGGCCVCVCWTMEDLNLFFSSRVAKDNELVEHQRLLLEEKKKSETLNLFCGC